MKQIDGLPVFKNRVDRHAESMVIILVAPAVSNILATSLAAMGTGVCPYGLGVPIQNKGSTAVMWRAEALWQRQHQ